MTASSWCTFLLTKPPNPFFWHLQALRNDVQWDIKLQELNVSCCAELENPCLLMVHEQHSIPYKNIWTKVDLTGRKWINATWKFPKLGSFGSWNLLTYVQCSPLIFVTVFSFIWDLKSFVKHAKNENFWANCQNRDTRRSSAFSSRSQFTQIMPAIYGDFSFSV